MYIYFHFIQQAARFTLSFCRKSLKFKSITSTKKTLNTPNSWQLVSNIQHENKHLLVALNRFACDK